MPYCPWILIDHVVFEDMVNFLCSRNLFGPLVLVMFPSTLISIPCFAFIITVCICATFICLITLLSCLRRFNGFRRSHYFRQWYWCLFLLERLRYQGLCPLLLQINQAWFHKAHASVTIWKILRCSICYIFLRDNGSAEYLRILLIIRRYSGCLATLMVTSRF